MAAAKTPAVTALAALQVKRVVVPLVAQTPAVTTLAALQVKRVAVVNA